MKRKQGLGVEESPKALESKAKRRKASDKIPKVSKRKKER